MKDRRSTSNRSKLASALVRRQRGQGMVELAVVVPVLLLLLFVGADLARGFYLAIEVSNAARAGAQYASHSVATATDTTAISNAATLDAANVPSLSVSSSYCTCLSPTPSGETACASSYCTDSPNANYVQVNTSATFTTIMKYPGVASSIRLPGQAIMQVQQ